MGWDGREFAVYAVGYIQEFRGFICRSRSNNISTFKTAIDLYVIVRFSFSGYFCVIKFILR